MPEFPISLEAVGAYYAGVIGTDGEVAWRPPGTSDVGGGDTPGGGDSPGEGDSPFDDPDDSVGIGGGGPDDDVGSGLPAPDGDGALESTGPGETKSTSGLPNYPAQGDVYCGTVRTPPSDQGGGRVELWYGVQDSSNLYFVGVDSDSDVVDIGYYSSGTKTVNDTLSTTIYDGAVYDIKLKWRTDGYQEATVTYRDDQQAEPTYSTNIIDDFEDGDLSEYRGDTSSFTIDTSSSPARLKQTVSSKESIVSADGDGLPNYFGRGDTFEVDMFAESTDCADTGIYYMYDASGRAVNDGYGYLVQHAYYTNGPIIYRFDGAGFDSGSPTELGRGDYSPGRPSDVRIKVTVDSNDQHTIETYDGGSLVDTVTFTDSNYTDHTGVGIRSDGDGAFENWTVETVTGYTETTIADYFVQKDFTSTDLGSSRWSTYTSGGGGLTVEAEGSEPSGDGASLNVNGDGGGYYDTQTTLQSGDSITVRGVANAVERGFVYGIYGGSPDGDSGTVDIGFALGDNDNDVGANINGNNYATTDPGSEVNGNWYEAVLESTVGGSETQVTITNLDTGTTVVDTTVSAAPSIGGQNLHLLADGATAAGTSTDAFIDTFEASRK